MLFPLWHWIEKQLPASFRDSLKFIKLIVETILSALIVLLVEFISKAFFRARSSSIFSISAGIGFIALFGVCIQNGVILISVFRKNLEEKMPLYQAIREGVTTRVRPVVMTALMAMIGLLPAAVSHGIGSETQKPLAVVVIGGLITSTALTLFVVPILYSLLISDRKHHPAENPTPTDLPEILS